MTPFQKVETPHNFFKGREMDFDIAGNNDSNSSIDGMEPKSGKICDDISGSVKFAPPMEADSKRNGHVEKATSHPAEATEPPPAAGAAATPAAGDEGDCQESACVKVADFTGTPTQHDAIFNSKISFPLNLTRMLESVKSKGLSGIVHWSENEKSFVICDIDLFLTDVLPLFFKSSEKTKIRSFYRKLNRWGFSMARKNAYNPNNIWHHPDFNRTTAVKALNQSLELGKAVDFLNMSTVSRGKKRRGTNDDSKECEHSHEDDDAVLAMPGAMGGADSFNLHRTILPQSQTTTNIIPGMSASMPTMLPSHKTPKLDRKKSRTLSLTTLSSRGNQQHNQRSTTSNCLLQYSQSVNTLRQGPSNSLSGLNSSSRGGSSNATFDLLSDGNTPGMASFSYRNHAPSPNIFAMSAQEMLNAHSASNNSFGHRITNSSTRESNNSPFFAAPGALHSHRRQLLQSEMTEEEDNELMAFFGSLARRLPPPREDDEEGCAAGEPDPLPHNF